MITAEQSGLVRGQIAMVLEVDEGAVVDEARLFADLGATGEDLKPLRVAIEAALDVQIEPIINEVNARTAIDQNGLLTTESKAQIVAYLGRWPDVPSKKVSFPDLFTVGMVEAIVAKAISGAAVEAQTESLQLSPELTRQVHQAVAEIYSIPLEQVHSGLELSSLTEDGDFDFARAMIEIKRALGISFDVELDQLQRGLGELSRGSATDLTMQKLRQLVPNIDSISSEEFGRMFTVGVVERICAAAIARRESPEAARNQPARPQSLGLYLPNWSWADQDWWASLPDQMGPQRFRLYLTGMLRAAFMESGSIDNENIGILEMAEKYAETGKSTATIEKKCLTLGTRSKWWRTRYVGALICILKSECTAENGATVLSSLEDAFHWKQPQVIAAARQWARSMVSPLNDPADLKPEWCTPEVLAHARQMHDNRAFGEFPHLGSLLETAGCDSAVILDHCRDLQRRHLRGDWLIQSILTAASAAPIVKSRGKATSPAAKAKRPKLPAMSNSQKKRFKELLVKERAGLPLAVAWAAVWQSDHTDDREHFKKKCRGLPADALIALGGMYPALRTVWPEVAVVRRLHLQSVTDLPAALVMHARISLMCWHTSPRVYELADHFRDAFVVGDEPALRWAFNELPCSQLMETDFGQWAYLAFRAIFARDEVRIGKLVDRWPYPANSQDVPAIELALLAILRGNPSDVVSALDGMLDQQRKSEEPDGFGGFSLNAHACYRAAFWRDPALVADFDVTQSAPWDAEFHAACMTAAQPLAGFDFSSTPPQLRDLLVTQAIPQWLRDLQGCPQNQGDYVGLILTDIGPTPDAVFDLLSAHLGTWDRAQFDHRRSMLPVTLAIQMYRLTCESFRTLLQSAGATAAIIG